MKNNNKSRLNLIFVLPLLILLEGFSMPLMAAEEPLMAAKGPLVMGVFPRRNATLTTSLFNPLAEHLSRELDREVKLVTAKDFSSFWRGVKDRTYDIVHYNQYHYIISADAYQVIAHNKEFGRSDVAGSLYVRNDSGITEVSQLKGRRIVFGGGEHAMMSYILPRYLLLEAGLDLDDYQARFASSPPNSMLALYFGQAEASGAGDILIELPVVKKNIDTAELTHLAKTEPLLHLPWAVKQGMNPALRNRIQQAMVGLEDTEAGRGVLKRAKMTGIGLASDRDYDPHRQIVAKVLGPIGNNH